MEERTKTKSYKITIEDGRSNDWALIKGLTQKNAEIIDTFVSQNYPLGMKEIKEIHYLLNLFGKKQNTTFGVEILPGKYNIEELLIVQISINKEDSKKTGKEDVWEKLLEEGFDIEFENDFIDIIEENFDRVEFVKDGIGLRDFLFISQLGIEGFLNPMFLIEDLAVENSEAFYSKEQKYLNNIEKREMVILSKLGKFFKETKRTLYLGVGFEENLEINDNEIIEMMQEAANKNTSIESIMREKRKFPVWYANVAKMPEEVTFLNKNAEMYLTQYLEIDELKILKKELKKMKKTNVLEIIEKI
jgi:hypothetical protein